MAPPEAVTVIKLSSHGSCALLLAEIVGEIALEGVALPERATTFALDPWLGFSEEPRATSHFLRIQSGEDILWLETKAEIELVTLSPGAFYNVPRLIRGAITSPWVRGFALWREAEGATRTALWLSPSSVLPAH